MQAKIPAKRPLPIIRVFVSSTFSDLKHERNALHAKVWPELERYCQQRGFTFQAIDLRWGVPAEAGLDHRTMRICFEELRRSQETSPEPNFLILLGNRYGWRPLPEVISIEEFESLNAAAQQIQSENPDPAKQLSDEQVELLKNAVSVLEDWYLLDENAKPFGDKTLLGEFVLRTRKTLLREVDYGKYLDATGDSQLKVDCREGEAPAEPRATIANAHTIADAHAIGSAGASPSLSQQTGKLRDTAAWVDVQFVLWSIVNRAFPASGLNDRFAAPLRDDAASDRGETRESSDLKSHDFSYADRKPLPSSVRFQASATEQEIWQGALQVANADRHVIAAVREVVDLDAFPNRPRRGDFIDLKDDGTPNGDSRQALADLKAELERRLSRSPIIRSTCQWAIDQDKNPTGDITTSHLDDFCREIVDRFKSIIIEQINAYWGCDLSADDATLAQVRGSQQELDLECADHLRFAGERAPEKTFVGRESELQRIRDYLRSKTNQPFVVHGPSGSGKTALLGKIIQEVTPSQSADGTRAKTGPIVLTRFIGTTPESSNLRSLLSSLCRELRQDFEMTSPLPTDLNELIDEFYSRLGKATAARPVFVFLDALDQLDAADRGRLVFWIRSPLSSTTDATCHARMVVSCLSPSDEFPEDSEACEPFRELKVRKLLGNHELDALDETDARQLFTRWLHGAGRSVSDTQQNLIWSALRKSSACRQPLFLKVLFGEASCWRSFDAPPSIPDSLAQLLEELFIRLGKPTEHDELIRIALSCLVSARYGLSEGELLEILYADPEYKTILAGDNRRNGHELPPDSNRIPIAPWTRLRSDLAPYLAERSAPGAAVMHFYHRQVEQAVWTKYLQDLELHNIRQRQLADYFRGKADPENDDTWAGTTGRPFEELTYHLRTADQSQEAATLMRQLRYLDARCALTDPSEILTEFGMLETSGDAEAHVWSDFLRPRISLLRKHPDTLPALAWHEGSPPLREAAEVYIRSGAPRRPWLRLDSLPSVTIGVEREETTTFEVFAKCPLTASAAAIARQRGCGLFLERLGCIRVVDLHEGRLTSALIEVPRTRLLAMTATDDGRLLAVVNENGGGTLFELKWSEDSLNVATFGRESFVCQLPELEAPVVSFSRGWMWWQAPDGTLKSRSLTSGTMFRSMSFARSSATEVRGIFNVAHSVAVCVVERDSTRLLIVNEDGSVECERTFAGRVSGGCVLAEDRLLLLRRDGPPIILEGDHLLAEVTAPSLPAPMALAVAACGGVVFQSLEPRIYFWNGQPGSQVTLATTFPIGAGDIRAMAANEQELFIVFCGAAICVRQGASLAKRADIRAVMPSTTGYHAVVQSSGGAYLVTSTPPQVHRLDDTTLGQIEAVANAREMLWMDVGGTLGHWLPPAKSLTPLGNKPSVTRAIAAGPDGIFFLADQLGRLFALGHGYGLMRFGTVPVDHPDRQCLIVAKHWLFWTGIGRGRVTELSGEDNLETLVVYRQQGEAGSYRLELAGTRSFPPSDGLWTLSVWDELRGRLACFFQTGGGQRQTVRVGTPEEFLTSREKCCAVKASVENFAGALPIENGSAWLVNSSKGGLVALDAEHFGELATFVGTKICSGLASGTGPGPSSLVIEANQDIVQCTLEGMLR